MARRSRKRTRIKRRISKITHIPTTRSGRITKTRRILTGGGGCLMYVITALSVLTALILLLV